MIITLVLLYTRSMENVTEKQKFAHKDVRF